ncbi:MAG TPA: DUF1127 domain-containing protein [Arenicellales bacterium]|nr:DUF1127 domain-containing protein [Arenicellales bacterium]
MKSKVKQMNTQTTITQPMETISGPMLSGGALRTARQALRRVIKSLLQSHWQRETVRELSSLPPYVLRDIGMQEGDIHEVAGELARERADAWARQAYGSNGFGG